MYNIGMDTEQNNWQPFLTIVCRFTKVCFYMSSYSLNSDHFTDDFSTCKASNQDVELNCYNWWFRFLLDLSAQSGV